MSTQFKKNQFIFLPNSTYNNKTLSNEKIIEWNEHSEKYNVMKKAKRESFMKTENYEQFETEQNGMKLIIEFSQKSDNESCFIKEDVRQILSNVLQEHLAKIS